MLDCAFVVVKHAASPQEFFAICASSSSPIVIDQNPDTVRLSGRLQSKDLLIYAKNGHRSQLLEPLAQLFPQHVQIHYGQHCREQLCDAVCRTGTYVAAAAYRFAAEHIVDHLLAALTDCRG
jgi:hypothetical protein